MRLHEGEASGGRIRGGQIACCVGWRHAIGAWSSSVDRLPLRLGRHSSSGVSRLRRESLDGGISQLGAARRHRIRVTVPEIRTTVSSP